MIVAIHRCSTDIQKSLDAVEKREALAGAEAFVIGLAQSRHLAVLRAGFVGEFGCLIEAVHNPVIADRDVGI